MLQHISSLFVKFTGALVSYALTVYISGVYGNEKLGYFSFFLSYALIFTLFMKFGTDIFLMKWVSIYSANKEEGKAKFMYLKLLQYHVVAGALITLLGYICTPWLINRFFPAYPDYRFFQISILSVFFANLHILHYEFLRGKQKLIAYTFYHTASIFLITLLLLLLLRVFHWEGDRNLEYAYLSACIVSFIFSFLHVSKYIKRQPSLQIEGFSIIHSLTKGFPYFSNNAIFILIGTLDIFMLSQYVQPEMIGEYAMIVKFAGFVSFPLIVMSANFSPQMVTISDPQMLQRKIFRITGWVTAGSLFVYLLLFFLNAPITAFLHIDDVSWFWVFGWVGLGYVFSAVCALNEVAMQMLGQEKLYQKIMFVTMLLNFVLNLLLIPTYKASGAALTTFITLVFWNAVTVYFVKKKLHLSTSLFN
jgi:O-antigen/teichoic acid export membrane protein